MYVAGPQDVAFDLQSRTYTLATGLLYFAKTRGGSIDADLSYIGVSSSVAAHRTVSQYARTSQRQTHTIVLHWNDGSKTPVGTFACRGEALAHARRLAGDLRIPFSAMQRIVPAGGFVL